jgi:LmbE family N-acetylglucosaminyl deacetylase
MALIEPVGHAATVCPPLPEFSARTRLLVVAPHPDDETIAAGVLIQRVLAAGGSVKVLLLTRGDNNPWPQRFLEHRLLIGADERLRWGHRRQQEMLAAMQRLGLPPTALECLGWPDLGVTDLLLEHPDRLRAILGDAMARFDPDLLVFPALADRHPDHSAAHVVVRLALRGLDVRPACFVYPVHGRPGSGARTESGGTGQQVAGKLAALDEHRSQMALSRKRMRRLALRPESLLPLDTDALDCLPWNPPLALRPWLRLSLASVAGGFSWPWNEAPLDHDGRGFRLSLAGIDDRLPRFVKLTCGLPSPWIFDRWGWCELAPADGGLA